MKNIKIKFDKKKLSSNIKQISLNWSLSFLKKKIKNNQKFKIEHIIYKNNNGEGGISLMIICFVQKYQKNMFLTNTQSSIILNL